MSETTPRAVLLDGRFFSSDKAAHALLQAALQFPAYYGENLDALYDCLTDLAPRPIHLYFATQTACSPAFLHVLTDAGVCFHDEG